MRAFSLPLQPRFIVFTAVVLMSSTTSQELVDPRLTPEQLLFRLFHEEGVRAYQKRPLLAQCRCSRERVETMLRDKFVESHRSPRGTA